jgi:hypothetical protein
VRSARRGAELEPGPKVSYDSTQMRELRLADEADFELMAA